MKVLIPSSPEFNYSQAKALYHKYKEHINDSEDFFQVISNTLFYSFFTDDGEFIGCVYFYKTPEGKLFLNGFSNRKMHLENIKVLQLASSWFDEDIYAKTPHKTAAFCLQRAGFIKCDCQLYIKKKGD